MIEAVTGENSLHVVSKKKKICVLSSWSAQPEDIGGRRGIPRLFTREAFINTSLSGISMVTSRMGMAHGVESLDTTGNGILSRPNSLGSVRGCRKRSLYRFREPEFP